LGHTKEELWDALASGRSGVGLLRAALPRPLPLSVAAECRQFEGKIEDFGPLEKEAKKAIRKGLKVMCRECQMGVAAAQRALFDARVSAGGFDPQRSGVVFGSDYMITLPEEFTEGVLECLSEQGQFDFARWATQGMPKMSPLWLLKYLPNMPASHLAIYNDFCGPNNSITLREASANLAAGEGFQIIARGHADLMVCGATGTRVHPTKLIHAVQQEEVAATNGDPAAASRPFDRDRTGMVLGEGAAAVVLEERSHAEARGAAIFGEILGQASSSAVGRRLVARRDLAMKNALAGVLANAGVAADQVGHLHAHGLSTRTGDVEEAWAINQVFGGRSAPLPVVAAKSYFGNLGAGAGMVELIASLLGLAQDRLFPVLNYRTPDTDCQLAVVQGDDCVAGANFVNLNVTPQGQASAVLVGRFEG